MQLVTFHTIFPPKLCNLFCWPMRVVWLHNLHFLDFILATILLIWLTLENSSICNVDTYMSLLNIILVTRECGLCTLIFCNSLFVRKKKMINVKTAVISSLINQEEDNYRPIILSDSCCWSSENMGFALISDSRYQSRPTAISFCSWARVHAIQFNVLQFILHFCIGFHVLKRFSIEGSECLKVLSGRSDMFAMSRRDSVNQTLLLNNGIHFWRYLKHFRFFWHVQ